MNIRKWAFIYTLDDGSAEPRIDELGSLVCVGVAKVADAPADRKSVV